MTSRSNTVQEKITVMQMPYHDVFTLFPSSLCYHKLTQRSKPWWQTLTSYLILTEWDLPKDSTTGIGNMFHGILGRIGGTIQWCLILAIILVLLYINRSKLFKLCGNKPSRQLNMPTPSLPTPSTDSDPTPNKLVNPPTTVEQPTTLPLVLASFTLHDVLPHRKNLV